MLSTYLQTQHKGNRKILSMWNRGFAAFEIRFNYMLNRFLTAQPIPSKGTRLIEKLLSNIPEDYFFTETPDGALYEHQLELMRESFNNAYSSTKMRTPSKDMFVSDSKAELLVDIYNTGAMSSLPINKPYGYWLDTAPIKILNVNSTILPTNTEGSQLVYKHSSSGIFEIGINPTLLMMKYIKYCRFKKAVDEPVDIQEFIHNDVIYPLRKDTYINWIINVIYTLTMDDSYLDVLVEQQDSNIVSSAMFKSTLLELLQFIEYVRSGKITVHDFLSSKWLINQSVTDYIETFEKEYATNSGIEYQYVNFIREVPLMLLILALMDSAEDNKTKYTTFITKLDRKVTDIEHSNMYSRINSYEAKEYSMDSLYEIRRYIRNIK